MNCINKGHKLNRTIELDGIKYTRQGIDFEHQRDAVFKLLGDEMLQALCTSRAIIAGGALTSVFSHKEVNDIDVYFRSKEDLLTAFLIATKDWDGVYLSHTDKSITIHDKDTTTTVQFIYFDYFADAEKVFEVFDYTVCMGAIEMGEDLDKSQVVLDPRFLQDIASRTLYFNKGTRFPYISLIRAKKYQERGYKIGKGQLLAIGMACAEKQITNWLTAKHQLGGVYGSEIDIKVKENGPFTIDKLFEIVNAIKDGDRVWIASDYRDIFFELTGIAYDDWKVRDAYMRDFENKLKGIEAKPTKVEELPF